MPLVNSCSASWVLLVRLQLGVAGGGGGGEGGVVSLGLITLYFAFV